MTNPRDWLHFALGLLVAVFALGVAIGLPAVWIPSGLAALLVAYVLDTQPKGTP